VPPIPSLRPGRDTDLRQRAPALRQADAEVIRLCERLPDEVVQEDPALLMYYDNSMTREGAG
jgi:hypothetical protein